MLSLYYLYLIFTRVSSAENLSPTTLIAEFDYKNDN